MAFAPMCLPEGNHDVLYSPAALQLGAFHWHVLKAANALEKRGHRLVETSGGFGRPELTDLGKEVGRDEINWWLTRKETNVEDLRTRTAAVLDAVQTMKKAFDALKKNDPPESYQGLLSSLREFATGHTAEIERLYEYVVWLEKDRKSTRLNSSHANISYAV